MNNLWITCAPYGGMWITFFGAGYPPQYFGKKFRLFRRGVLRGALNSHYNVICRARETRLWHSFPQMSLPVRRTGRKETRPKFGGGIFAGQHPKSRHRESHWNSSVFFIGINLLLNRGRLRCGSPIPHGRGFNSRARSCIRDRRPLRHNAVGVVDIRKGVEWTAE